MRIMNLVAKFVRKLGVVSRYGSAALAGVAILSGGMAANADPIDVVGLWQFDGTLDNSINPLQPLTASGFAPTFTTSTIGGELTSAQTLTMMANLGGHRTNEYTLIMDVQAPSLSPYVSLLQNNPANTSDVDVFVRTNGEIDTGYTAAISPAGSVSAGTWHRIAIRRSPGAIVAFVDGAPGTTGNGYGVNDGDFSMPALTHLFSDNSGDTTPMLVNSVAYYAEALSNADIAALGGATAAGLAAPSSSAAPAPISSWDFNGDLSNGSNVAEPLTASGFAPSYTTSTIGGETANVLDLPGLSGAQSLDAINSIGANGGGTLTNEWALAMDINASTVSSFVSLLETNPANNDDVDIFFRPVGTIDLESAGAVGASGTFPANDWMRLVLSQEADAASGGVITEAWLDGILVGSATNALDGDTALESLFLLFSDNSGDTGPMLINSVAFFDQGLTPLQIHALGGPSAQGVFADIQAQNPQVPEPASVLSWIVVGIGLLFWRRKKGSA